MKDEIKEILEKLKDNIPIEEYRSEGTSDGLTHYEEDKDSWQYKLYNYMVNLQEELNEYKFPDCKSKDIEVVRANLVDMIRKNKRLEQENERLKQKVQTLINQVKKLNLEAQKYFDLLMEKGLESKGE